MQGTHDLRGYIEEIERDGGLCNVAQRVSKRYEIAALTAAADGGKALLFTDVAGSKMRLVSNLLGTRSRFAAAINADPKKIHPRMISCIRRASKPRISDIPARFLDNSSRSIGILPIVRHFEKESGPFITSSVVHVINPDTGMQNSSFHRLMPVSPTDFTIRMVEGRHLHRCFVDAKEHGEDLPVAVTIGVHPAVSIAGAYQEAWGRDEMYIANSILGGGLTMSKSPTLGIAVPSETEIVIEGRILKDKTRKEWMVEMLRTYDHARAQPLLEIDRIYYRNSAIFHDILSGYSEHRLLMGMPIESKITAILTKYNPRVRRVALTGGGSNWLHAVVQIRKRYASDPGNIIQKAFEAHRSLKQVVIVDEDINPDSAESVEYAMATRFQADRDLVIIRGVRGSSLDPSSDQKNLKTAKMGIDATRPSGRRPEGFELARIPGRFPALSDDCT